jgi:hypothetical protein
VPHVSDEHDRANVGKDARVLIEGAAKERRRSSARAAGVESMAVDCDNWVFRSRRRFETV